MQINMDKENASQGTILIEEGEWSESHHRLNSSDIGLRRER